MKQAMKRIAAALACAAVVPFGAQAHDKVIRIGVVMPISGPASYFGVMGKEGIDLLKRTPDVDIVLMDVMMPGLDGLDTMRIVRQLEGYQNLPIVAVTAKAMMGDREKCLEAGANDYVAKPVNVDELIATLARAVPAHA